MASDLQNQLASLRAKTHVVGEKYRYLKQAYDASRQEAAALKAELRARDEEIEKLRMQVEYLSVASTVRTSGNDLKAARDMVADLVRDIDRCIADLME